MKRVLSIGLIALLMIGFVSPTVSAIDPVIIFKGTLYLDGAPAGSGNIIDVTNLNAERSFELVTNGQGYYAVDVGQDADIWDMLLVSPDVTGTDPYDSDVMITQFVLNNQEIIYDIYLQLNVNEDDDVLNFGSHKVHAGKWDTHITDWEDGDEFEIEEAKDLTFKFSWQEHIQYAVSYGPVGNQIDLTADAWDFPNTYDGKGTWQVKVYQLKYVSEDRADTPFHTENHVSSDDDMNSLLNFWDYGQDHEDPQVDFYYNTINFPNNGPLWYKLNDDWSKNWKIEIVLQWKESLYPVGNPPQAAIWESPSGGVGWNDWDLTIELINL